jgi:hypothetical protein
VHCLKLNLAEVSWIPHGELQAEAGRGAVGVATRLNAGRKKQLIDSS